MREGGSEGGREGDGEAIKEKENSTEGVRGVSNKKREKGGGWEGEREGGRKEEGGISHPSQRQSCPPVW